MSLVQASPLICLSDSCILTWVMLYTGLLVDVQMICCVTDLLNLSLLHVLMAHRLGERLTEAEGIYKH